MSAADPSNPRRGGPSATPEGHWREVLLVAGRLGLSSFGGPTAHIGFFHAEYVVRRRWLDEAAFADIVALAQMLPGPASSQVGIAIGLSRAGYAGALAAWVGFTLPSALALVLFASGLHALGDPSASGWLRGVKAAAVAVVAQAVWGMMRTLAPDRARATLAVAACVLTLFVPTSVGQVGAIVGGGLAGAAVFRGEPAAAALRLPLRVSRRAGALALLLFATLLLGLPLVEAVVPARTLRLFDVFYRTGSLVFGGGHVVLPLLQAAVVVPGWVSANTFMAGYGAAQAIPGPLFTFAAYLGAAMMPTPTGWAGAALCLIAIFLPSFLLIVGVLPFWARFRAWGRTRAALKGISAAVVGLLLAAFYDPVWTVGIETAGDFAVAVSAFLLLVAWRAPPWTVVILCAVACAAVSRFGL